MNMTSYSISSRHRYNTHNTTKGPEQMDHKKIEDHIINYIKENNISNRKRAIVF